MSTKDVGRLFFTSVKTTEHPLYAQAYSQEVEWPYRMGRGIALKLTKRFVLVIGWWTPSQLDEDEALFSALNASSMYHDPEEIGAWGDDD